MTAWLTDPVTTGFSLRAVLELILLGVVGGAAGCWIVLYRISYGAESLAHGMLPGLVAASLLGVPLIVGGAAGIILAGLLIAVVSRFAPGRPDTAIAVVVTTLFGLGALMALSPASPVGIDGLLFGDPLGVSDGDLLAAALPGAAVLLVLWRGHDRLLAVGFDREGSAANGLSPGRVQGLLFVLLAITVLIGVQGLGTLLVAAILVGPAATARLLTRRPGTMIALGILVAVVAGIGGIYLSWHARIAAGAAVVACVVALYLTAVAISALRGQTGSPARSGPATGEQVS